MSTSVVTLSPSRSTIHLPCASTAATPSGVSRGRMVSKMRSRICVSSSVSGAPDEPCTQQFPLHTVRLQKNFSSITSRLTSFPSISNISSWFSGGENTVISTKKNAKPMKVPRFFCGIILCNSYNPKYFLTAISISSPRRSRSRIVPSGPKRMMCGMPLIPYRLAQLSGAFSICG